MNWKYYSPEVEGIYEVITIRGHKSIVSAHGKPASGITESQDGSGWKEPEWFVWSKPLCSSGVMLDHVAQDCVQMLLVYLQWGKLHNFCGKSLPVIGHCTVNKFFPMLRWNFLSIGFCPLPLVLLLGTNKKSLAPCSFHPPFFYWWTLMRSSLNCLFWRLNRFNSTYPWKREAPEINRAKEKNTVLTSFFCIWVGLWSYNCIWHDWCHWTIGARSVSQVTCTLLYPFIHTRGAQLL